MNSKIISIIEEHTKAGVLFVLKGYSLDLINIEKGDLRSVSDNPLARLIQIMQQERQVIAFDEFVCLYNFVIQQYKKIYIIENWAFWNLYRECIINCVSKKMTV